MTKRIHFLVAFLFSATLTGCPGAIDSLGSSISGAHIEEKETNSLICGQIQFGDRVSISCVKK